MIKQNVDLPKLHNFFTIKVIDAKTKKVIQNERCENIVLTQIYEHWFKDTVYNGINAMAYGDGTGTIAASRTTLFSEKGRINLTGVGIVTEPTIVTLTGKIVLSESAYIGGIISELGLVHNKGSYGTARLATHAMLVDSEGAPITIGPKTNTQIWEIYCTAYLQKGAGMTDFPNNLSTMFSSQGTSSSSRRLFSASVFPQNIALSSSGSYDAGTKTLTMSNTNIATSAGNSDGFSMFETTDILGINISPLSPSFQSFPDHDAFPVFTFSERSIGSGDGVKKFFGFDNGFFIEGSEVVKVDGVTKIKDVDYILHQGYRQILNRNDYALPYNGRKTIAAYNSDSSKTIGTLVTADAVSNVGFSIPRYGVLDFGEVVNIKDFYVGTPTVTSSRTAYYAFSLDGSTWFGQAGYTIPGWDYWMAVHLNEVVKARYVWIDAGGSSAGTFNKFVYYGPPQVEFLSPPANSTAITATWQTDIPPKNTNFFYDINYIVGGSW